MAVTTTSLYSDPGIYYDRLFLDRLEKDLMFVKFGEKKPLPKRAGLQITWTRLDNLAAITSTLTQGTAPTETDLTSTQISATPLQYGAFTKLSDRLEMQSIDPIVEEVINVMGYLANLSYDTIIRNTLHNAVTNQFAAGAANEAATSAVMTAAELRKAVTTLRKNAVHPLDGGTFKALVAAQSEFDLLSDTATGAWLDVNKYVSQENTKKGRVGVIYGTEVFVSQNMQTGTGASSATTYRNYVFGRGAYGISELSGAGVSTIVKPHDSGGVANPLNQYSTVGYKFMLAAKVLDANRAVEVYATSAA